MATYPLLFSGGVLSWSDSALIWSDLPEGWYALADGLCASIEKELTDEQRHGFYVTQIKEKFGTLRFRCGGTATAKVKKMIAYAEEESASICMECGDAGRSRHVDWIATLCDFCDLERRIRAMRVTGSISED